MKPILSKQCSACGKVVLKLPHHSMKTWISRVKFCSRQCRAKEANPNGTQGSFRKEMFIDKTKHPRWIDGRSTTKEYKTLYARNGKIKRRFGERGRFTYVEWMNLKKQYGYMCLCCKKCEPIIKLEVDHIIPLIKGGQNIIANIQPLCRDCNGQKRITIIDYRTIARLG